jgi:hypothetical protein
MHNVMNVSAQCDTAALQCSYAGNVTYACWHPGPGWQQGGLAKAFKQQSVYTMPCKETNPERPVKTTAAYLNAKP